MVPSCQSAEDGRVVEDLRAAWRGLTGSARYGRRTGVHGFPPLASPYFLGAGDADEALAIDLDEDTTITFTAFATSRLRTAAERWAASGSPCGRVDGYEATRALLYAAAATVARGEDPNAQFDSVVLRRWASVVAVPIGGAFLLDGPEHLGQRAVIGHLDRDTEAAIAELALRWYRPLGGFQFNEEASWTEMFLNAENDSDVAGEIEQQLVDEGGWMPLVLAVGLDAVGARAEVETFALAQALAGALHLLSRNADDEPASLLMPWVLDLDGPSVAYFPNDGASRSPAALCVDTCGTVPGHPTSSRWRGQHRAVDIRELFERGHQARLTAVVHGGLDETNPLDLRHKVARACGLIAPAVSAPLTALGAVAAASAASLVSPHWEDRRLAVVPTDVADRLGPPMS